MKKQTVLDRIEIERDGTLCLRFAKEVVDDDGTVLSRHWHRTSVEADGDVPAQMAAVNQHLQSMNNEPVSVEEIGRIKATNDAIKPILRPAWDSQPMKFNKG